MELCCCVGEGFFLVYFVLWVGDFFVDYWFCDVVFVCCIVLCEMFFYVGVVFVCEIVFVWCYVYDLCIFYFGFE